MQAQKNLNVSTSPEFINAKRIDLTLTCELNAPQTWLKVLSETAPQLSFTEEPSPHLRRGLAVLIANFITQNGARYVALSKSWADYPAPSRYQKDTVPLAAMVAATEFLRNIGLITVHPGSKQSGLCTRLELHDELLKTLSQHLGQTTITKAPCEEPLVLRNNERALVEYTDTRNTQSLRRNLSRVNAFLRGHTAIHDGNVLNTDLTRIFKNSFLEGGRFYRADHLALKSEERREIKLNDENVVEIDYSCLHVNMLYIRETGRTYPGDAYETESQQIPRDVFKIILQIILNCDSEYAAILATSEALESRGFHLQASTAVAMFLRKHQAIRKYFFSGVGLRLQYEDSVIAERVLLKAVQDGVPVLPVHDSFIAPASQESWLLEAMEQASWEVLGTALPVKIKRHTAKPKAA